EPPMPSTLRLEPEGQRAQLVLAPTFDPNAPPDAPAGEEGARLLAELARRSAAEVAVEAPLELRDLGGGATGWYFAATDRELGPGGREPGPDEYRCLVQGVAVVGGVTLSFTLLDDGPGPHREAALEVVRRARHEPLFAAGPPGGVEPAPAAPDGGGRVAALSYPGKGWAAAMEVPGFEVQEPEARADGRLVSLVALHEGTGVVASLVLSDAGSRRTAAACAEADWLRLSAFLPEAAGRAPPAGPLPRANYLVRELRGRRVDQQNLSAWWYRDGVCVHAHVSLMGFEPRDLPALERILASVRFEELL
ncbi:MAG: hypothetical protein NDI82_02815, partial [Anaeromyxobacteraceae bacterium]|nr:hypothetical protein [Anaeromyxobacteraceae bacterium]